MTLEIKIDKITSKINVIFALSRIQTSTFLEPKQELIEFKIHFRPMINEELLSLLKISLFSLAFMNRTKFLSLQPEKHTSIILAH